MKTILMCLGVLLISIWALRALLRFRTMRKVTGCLDEIASWQKDYHSPSGKLRRAKKAVVALREGSGWYGDQGSKLLYTVEMARNAGFSYEDIDTSPEEIRSFHAGEGEKRLARRLLDELRKDCGECDCFQTDRIRHIAKGARFSLEDIGTSETELAIIERQRCITLYRKSLDNLKELPHRADVCSYVPPEECYYQNILQVISDGDCTWEELGTTKAELDSLLEQVKNAQHARRSKAT